MRPNKFFTELHGEITDKESEVSRSELLLVRHGLSNGNVLFKYIVNTGKTKGTSRLE